MESLSDGLAGLPSLSVCLYLIQCGVKWAKFDLTEKALRMDIFLHFFVDTVWVSGCLCAKGLVWLAIIFGWF